MTIIVMPMPDTARVTVGIAGPSGPPGPSGGTSITRTALTAIGGHRVVRSAGSTAVNYADHTDADHGDDTLGVTLDAAALGASVQVVREGPVSFAGWSWTPQEPVFLAADGLLTQTPSESAAFVQIIGFAETAGTIFVDIQPPIYL